MLMYLSIKRISSRSSWRTAWHSVFPPWNICDLDGPKPCFYSSDLTSSRCNSINLITSFLSLLKLIQKLLCKAKSPPLFLHGFISCGGVYNLLSLPVWEENSWTSVNFAVDLRKMRSGTMFFHREVIIGDNYKCINFKIQI